MMNYLYNVLLVFWVMGSVPSLLWQYIYRGKYRGNLLARLGLSKQAIKAPSAPISVWIHAVSLGETKAALPLIRKFRAEYSDIEIYFSTTTETAQKEAKRFLGGLIDHLFFLPLDFSWIAKKYVRTIRPNLFVLMESDFWPNLLREVKYQGGTVLLANGKISEKSFRRVDRFKRIGTFLFGNIDVFCMQSATYQERFAKIGIPQEKIIVTGNMKYDAMPAPKVLIDEVPSDRTFITLASTHDNEEEMILDALKGVSDRVTFLIAPRHPERFPKVAHLLERKEISYEKFTEMGGGLESASKNVVLVNTIGDLDKCYALSKIVIVGGSFVTHVGGHNIYEPIRFRKRVFFGPYMHNQEELVKDVLQFDVAQQVSLEDLAISVEKALEQSNDNGRFLAFEEFVKGATEKTWEQIAFC